MQATVFISYARADSDGMKRLKSGLVAAGFRVLVDTADIGAAEIWRKRLADLIRQSDSVIFLISPSSVQSPDCRWELDESERHAKRLFPVRIRETPDSDIPGRLLQLNHVMAYPDERLEPALRQLIEALRTDLSWLREHTSMEELAQRWVDAGESSSRLLRGADIEKAEQWRDRRPQNAPDLTEHQRRFIATSRRNVETTVRRRTILASGAAFVAILIALGMNEMRIAAGLSAFEARVTAEATSIIESLNTQNEAYALRRALHTYSAASQTLEKPPDVVWNALRLAYAQYRTESIATTKAPVLALTMPSNDTLLALDNNGDLWSFGPALQSPSRVAIERPLEGAQSHGISPSQRSIWARRGSAVRLHDLAGKLIPLQGDLSADEDSPFDAAPDCVAALHSGRVTVYPVGMKRSVPKLEVDWPKQNAGQLRGIRVSETCERLLLVGESGALLYKNSGHLWTPKKLGSSPGESWSASPNLKFLTSAYSGSREVGRYDVEADDWKYFLTGEPTQREKGRLPQGVDEVIANDAGGLLIRVGPQIEVFDAEADTRFHSAGSIIPKILALSPSGDRLAVYKTIDRSISLMRVDQTPLFETVLTDVGLPARESISTLKICGDQIAVGGDGGGVVVRTRKYLEDISTRIDARGLVRRIDCDRNGMALIVSEHGVLDVRHQREQWLPEELGALSSYSGRAIFPDTDDGLIVVSDKTVTRYSQEGKILESIQRAPNGDDTAIIGGGVTMLADPRRLLLLGESTTRRNEPYIARACAYLWRTGEPTRTVCKSRPNAVRFSTGGFLDDTTVVGAGLGGILSVMPLSGESLLNLEGAPQIVPHAMAKLDERRFALSSFGGELHIWTRNGTLLKPSLSFPYGNGALSITSEPETGEVLAGSGRSILRTVLSGTRLRARACDALAKTERVARESLEFCRDDKRRSLVLLRVGATPMFEPLE